MSSDSKLEEIIKLTKEYNKLNINTRLIVEKHPLSCHCSSCWYVFDGDKNKEKENSIYTDIYNSNVRFYKD
jgi:hypothetical protein